MSSRLNVNQVNQKLVERTAIINGRDRRDRPDVTSAGQVVNLINYITRKKQMINLNDLWV